MESVPVQAEESADRRQPSPDEVRNQLDKILASPIFYRSERLRRFLRFVVDHFLAGKSGEIKESAIGRDVFDRKDNFDPGTDSIVRVEARRLRSKLREYYEKFGPNDPVLIGVFPGSYVPVFEYRTAVSGLQQLPSDKTRPPMDVRAVAVLPFANLSPDPDQDFFCDGVTEEILNTLAMVPELRVMARTSVFFFKGKNIDLREIGRQLGVGTIIEGSVRKAGDRVRITAQAIDASTGVHLWSKSFDRDLDDVFAVQDEIARAVTNALRISLVTSAAPSLSFNTTRTEAYIHFLRGRHYWNEVSEGGVAAALSQFTQAIAMAPRYAPAHAGLALGLAKLTFWCVLQPREGMLQAKQSALEALRLDPRLASAHAILGAILFLGEWNWEAGAGSIGRAIALEPSNVLAHTALAAYHLCQGCFGEAKDAVERCTKLDPISPLSFRSWGWYYYFTRDYDRAIESLQSALAIDPHFREAEFFLAYAYLRKARYADAIEALHRLPDAPEYRATKWGALGEVWAMAGDKSAAHEALKTLEVFAGTTYVSPMSRLSVYAGLGDWERVFEELEHAYADHSTWLNLAKIDPGFDAIRSDTRFVKLLERIGL
jgi:serine/threonine-protein kinase